MFLDIAKVNIILAGGEIFNNNCDYLSGNV